MRTTGVQDFNQLFLGRGTNLVFQSCSPLMSFVNIFVSKDAHSEKKKSYVSIPTPIEIRPYGKPRV